MCGGLGVRGSRGCGCLRVWGCRAEHLEVVGVLG